MPSQLGRQSRRLCRLCQRRGHEVADCPLNRLFKDGKDKKKKGDKKEKKKKKKNKKADKTKKSKK